MDTSIFSDLGQMITNYEAEMFKKCLPPCTEIKIRLQEILYKKKGLNNAFIEAKSKDCATVYKKVYSYDIFSLTVDLGSALGLWMGLSCLSILDHILLNWISMKKYWKR